MIYSYSNYFRNILETSLLPYTILLKNFLKLQKGLDKMKKTQIIGKQASKQASKQATPSQCHHHFFCYALKTKTSYIYTKRRATK